MSRRITRRELAAMAGLAALPGIRSTAAAQDAGASFGAVSVLFDTDIMGDVDDVGAVAMLHALASRGEARILAMGVSSKHEASPLCLSALNQYFGRPEIPIGVNKGEGFLRDTRYADTIAAEWPHRLASAAEAPEAGELFERTLQAQSDHSVVLVTVGQLSNVSSLLRRPGGVELARQKTRVWVCMGGEYPSGREANLRHHAAAAKHAIEAWPGHIYFSGYELGLGIRTGGKLSALPASSPVRKAYELFNGIQPHMSWDQTAVLLGVRYVGRDCPLWTLSGRGRNAVDEEGGNAWVPDAQGPHRYLMPKGPMRDAEEAIEALMLTEPGA